MNKQYEAIILGSGMSGSLLATVLAKHNVNVCIIDNGHHPRFSIGESTVPETTANLKIMSKLYDIPEIGNFSNFLELRDKVGSSHGVKKGFSFCYHREGKSHNKEECTQTATLSPPLGPDAHWYRQDTDQYMLSIATHYGVDVFQDTQVEDVDVTPDHAKVKTSCGMFEAEFLIDSSGAYSVAAKKMQIHDKVADLDTDSRGFFTHMVNVGRWEDVLPAKQHKMPYLMDQTTLHHIFDGGWMWVIPFDNHKQASNNIASVGVVLDAKKWPKQDISTEEEFANFLDKFPDIKKQFESAKPVRKWVSAKSLQYSSKKLYIDRYFAMPQVATFVDPLFSSGLVLVTHVINVLGQILIDSFNNKSLEVGRLKALEEQVLKKNKIYDRLISTTYKSFNHFELWNAWHRVWEIGTYFNTLAGMRCILKYEETGDKQHLRDRYNPPYNKPLALSVKGYDRLFDDMVESINKVDSGHLTVAQGTADIYKALGEFEGMPYFIQRTEEHVRTSGDFTLLRLAHIFIWAKLFGPESTQHYYDFGMLGYIRLSVAYALRYGRRNTGSSLHSVWFMFFSRAKRLTSKPVAPVEKSRMMLRRLSIADEMMHDNVLSVADLLGVKPFVATAKDKPVVDTQAAS